LRERGIALQVTGIATRTHGIAIDPRGLDLRRAVDLVRSGRSLAPLHRGAPVSTSRQFIKRVPADVLVEITPLDPHRGQPATAHVRAALSRGLHVVTANKGPVAFALKGLQVLARRRRRLFLYEGAVMDGTPVFNLVARCLPGVKVLSFRGTLNSTTNLILSRMEEDRAKKEALAEARALGIAEADASNDLEGWDAAVKVCALANALMGLKTRPSDVRRRGIGGLTPARLRRALRQGKRIRLVARGRRFGHTVELTVRPEAIPLGDPLSGTGPDTALVLETDLMGEIGVFERGGTVDQTAYALLSDLLTVASTVR
jgi:homoserine dehydrogenase